MTKNIIIVGVGGQGSLLASKILGHLLLAQGHDVKVSEVHGMRGLMADPSGKIIEIPITANFREGLSVSDYFISSHGARKGLADTALRTADSGYLTRRLVDVAQDVIVREEDCDVSQINLKLERALLATETFDALEILSESLIGRVLAKPIFNIIHSGTTVDEEIFNTIRNTNLSEVKVEGNRFVGVNNKLIGQVLAQNIATDEIVINQDTILEEACLEKIGELKISEITLRGRSLTSPNSASHSLVSETIKLGTHSDIERENLRHTFIHEIVGKELAKDIVSGGETYSAGINLTHEMLDKFLADETVGEVFVRNNNVRGIEVEAITEGSGVIESLEDRIVGRVLAEDIYDAQGNLVAKINDEIDKTLAKEIATIRHNQKVKIRSVLTCKSQFGVCIKCYGADLANQAPVEIGEAVGIIAAQSIGEPGTQLTMRTFHTGGVAGDDITQGLPRVEELFEARKPKHNAIISEVDGTVQFGVNDKNDLPMVTVKNREYTIPFGSRLAVKEGDEIKAGAKITEGPMNPHDILRILGLKETQRYLVYEVQKVYKSQGVEINDKHLEVMVRQMLHKVKIEESGDTEFLPGEYIDINVFEAQNTKVIEARLLPAVAKPILLGITKASLATDSFLSAASFQETTRVLTDAAIKGKVDPLIGLKENVIIGKLIPAGTGMSRYRDLQVLDNA